MPGDDRLRDSKSLGCSTRPTPPSYVEERNPPSATPLSSARFRPRFQKRTCFELGDLFNVVLARCTNGERSRNETLYFALSFLGPDFDQPWKATRPRARQRDTDLFLPAISILERWILGPATLPARCYKTWPRWLFFLFTNFLFLPSLYFRTPLSSSSNATACASRDLFRTTPLLWTSPVHSALVVENNSRHNRYVDGPDV